MMDNVLYRTNIQLHARNYKSMITHTFHPRSPLHSASLHCTTLQSPFFTSLHFWKFRHHASKTLHFSSLIITLLTLFLKICDLHGEAASVSAGGRFHSSTVLCTKAYLPMSVLSFLIHSIKISQLYYYTQE
jgi:hypothetical protein